MIISMRVCRLRTLHSMHTQADMIQGAATSTTIDVCMKWKARKTMLNESKRARPNDTRNEMSVEHITDVKKKQQQ